MNFLPHLIFLSSRLRCQILASAREERVEDVAGDGIRNAGAGISPGDCDVVSNPSRADAERALRPTG